MSKTGKIVLAVAVIALLLFGIILAVYNNFKTEEVGTNNTNNNILDDANTGLENFINNIFDENTIDDNSENKENTQNDTNTQSGNQNTSSGNNKPVNQTTPGEKKAIELVRAEWKKEWGSLDEVSFNNVMIQNDGKYVVSVNDSKTTKVIRRYVVDTTTGLVEEK